jgi:hypothetical protein
MSSPRDLSLERFSDRDGMRSAHLGEIAHVGSPLAGSNSTWASQAAYEALNDAVFTAPGVLEWLAGLRRAVAAFFADKDSTPHVPAEREVKRTAGPHIWRP